MNRFEKESPLLKGYNQEVLPPEAFEQIDILQRWAYYSLLETKELGYLNDTLVAYEFGTRFLHSEAYRLCCVSKIWPEFCYDTSRIDFVLRFEDLNSIENLSLREEFVEWFDENRGEVTSYAAQLMKFGID